MGGDGVFNAESQRWRGMVFHRVEHVERVEGFLTQRRRDAECAEGFLELGRADACAPFGFDFVESTLRSKASSAHLPRPLLTLNHSIPTTND